MDCGHTWTTDEDADKCVCPKCKAKLEVQRTKRQKAMSSTYFSVLTERKGLQLMRAFQMKAYYRKGQKADIYCWEVARYWMNEKGKVEVMARKRTISIWTRSATTPTLNCARTTPPISILLHFRYAPI